MKTFKGFINEGLRDKMSPKPHEEILEHFKSYFEGLKVIRDDETILKITKLDPKNLYLIYDWEEHYEMFDKYFKDLINKDSVVKHIEYEDFQYEYYMEEKIMWFYDLTLTEGWYFDGEHIDDIIKFIIKNYK